MLQMLFFNQISQLLGTVFSHDSEALHIEAEAFSDDGDVDSLSPEVNPGVPDAIHLAHLQIGDFHGFVKAGIHTDGGNHRRILHTHHTL
jgi:hypothetical protein